MFANCCPYGHRAMRERLIIDRFEVDDNSCVSLIVGSVDASSNCRVDSHLLVAYVSDGKKFRSRKASVGMLISCRDTGRGSWRFLSRQQ